jgi:hypothetical protein
MMVFGSKRSGDARARRRRRAERRAEDALVVTAEGRLFEGRLLVAGLPAAGQEALLAGLLLAGKRPAWSEEEVGDEEPAEQCRCWWPFAEERLRQQTPRSLLLTMQTELEGGLRTMETRRWRWSGSATWWPDYHGWAFWRMRAKALCFALLKTRGGFGGKWREMAGIDGLVNVELLFYTQNVRVIECGRQGPVDVVRGWAG